jgi:aromatic ring-opening dioxygenase catalytic subunit (LigB family)
LARLCSVIATSHSPFLFIEGDRWGQIRKLRGLPGRYAPDAPVDSAEENLAKHVRCMSALAELRTQLDAARPDVLIVFGDDQEEQFTPANTPALAVYAGAEFAGYRVSRFEGVPLPDTVRAERPRTGEHWAAAVPGHPGFARHLTAGLVLRGFEPALMESLPVPDEGMSHAIMRPLHCLRPGFDLPTVPVFVNCYHGPRPTARRCYKLGRAVRELIESWPSDARVAVIGSGGLWHTPLDADATIDERFNADILAAVESGRARLMAAVFDRGLAWPQDNGRAGQPAGARTAMDLGYGSGTGETRNWVAAAAVADGSPGVVVDSVPIWASPVGVAFAYWPLA